MGMPSADDFLLEESAEKKLKKSMEAAKQTTMGFLGKAVALYKRAEKGDPSPTLMGKAIAYITCFLEMAPEVGIKKEMYSKIITNLSEKLGAMSIKVEQDSRKTIVEHRGDPAIAAIEQKKVELRERELEIRVEDHRKPKEALPAPEPGTHVLMVDSVVTTPVPDEAVIKEVSDWLVHSQLGYERAEANRRAKLVYQPGVPVEDLVAKACRVS